LVACAGSSTDSSAGRNSIPSLEPPPIWRCPPRHPPRHRPRRTPGPTAPRPGVRSRRGNRRSRPATSS
jgi:hypothetical protein